MALGGLAVQGGEIKVGALAELRLLLLPCEHTSAHASENSAAKRIQIFCVIAITLVSLRPHVRCYSL